MIVFWLVPLILLLVGIKYLFFGGGPASGKSLPPSEPPVAKSALSVLEERYAKGEIGRDEFLQKRGDILEK